MKIRAFLTLVGAVSCFAVAACSSDSTGGAGGAGGNATTSTGTAGGGTTTTGTGGAGGGATTTTGTGGAGGGAACAPCALLATGQAGDTPACPGSQDLADAIGSCACVDADGCSADCGDNVCMGMDQSDACTTCLTTGACQAQYDACLNDTGM
jgi:hypothetical protein